MPHPAPAAAALAILLSLAPVPTHAADDPLPPGAIRRLGEVRFRPGARVTHLAFSPDGKRLASWGNWMYFEDRLSVWDVATGREVHTQAAAENRIADLCWGPGGRGYAALLAGDSAPNFQVYAFEGKTTPPAPTGMVGRVVAVPGGGRPFAAPTYERVALSPDGSRIAAVVVPAGAATGSLALFDAEAVAAGKKPDPTAEFKSLPTGKSTGLKFVRGGKAVAALVQDGKGGQSVVVWDTEKKTASEPVTVADGVHQGSRQSFDVAEDGSAVAVGLADGTVRVYDLPAGKVRLAVKKHSAKWSEVSAVKFVNGGRNVLSAGRDNKQLVWDAKTGAEVAALNGHGSWVEAVAVSPDGKLAATAGQDSLVRLWDAGTWKPVVPPRGPRETVWRLEVSRDGKYAAAGCGTGGHVWELATGTEVRTVPTSYQGGYVLFTPEGGLLTGTAAGDLSLHPLPAGDAKPVAAKGKLLDFSPDGKTLLTARGNAVVVWDWPTCRQRLSVPTKGDPMSAAVSPDGRTAVIGPGPAAVIDLDSGKVTETGLKLHWFNHAAGFAPGGKVVCGTGDRSQPEAWSVASPGLAYKFEVPTRRPQGMFSLMSLAVSPDGRRAASSHSDGGIAVYETVTGQLLAHFAGHRDGVISAVWVPGGDRVLSAGCDHQVLVWDTSLRALAGKADPLPPKDRRAAWDRLGTQPAKEAIRTMAALAADPDGSVTLIAAELRPGAAPGAATLDRIFRDLDDADFTVRDKASRELNKLGAGAVGGVRERVAAATSAEVRQRGGEFLRRFDAGTMSPERVRFSRALDVLAAAGTPAARKLVADLAGGAPGLWQTDAARQALGAMPVGR